MLGREGNVLKSASSREGEKGQDDDVVEEEEAEGLPSSYCMMYVPHIYSVFLRLIDVSFIAP